MFKKMLSILLAFAMLLSMIPASYAEDDITIAEESSEAEDILIVDDDAEPAPASAESEGSRTGIWAARQIWRVSCSFWEL